MACSSKFTIGKVSLRLSSPLLVPYVYILSITISVSIWLYRANLLHSQYHISIYGLLLVGLSQQFVTILIGTQSIKSLHLLHFRGPYLVHLTM